MKRFILVVAAGLAAAGSARGDIIPTLDSIGSIGAADFTWSYRATLTQDENAVSGGSNGGDYFTIYDFGGFIPGSNEQPPGWTFSFKLVGKTPPLVRPIDDHSIYNLTWHYVGGPGLPDEVDGPVNLGLFSADSTFDQSRLGWFAAEATRNSGPQAGTPIDNVGRVSVPIPEMSALLPMIGVCGLGAIGVATSRWRKRARR